MGKGADICTLLTGFPLEKVVVFDTETTGTSPYGGDEVLSIGICDGMGKPLFSSYVRPTRHRSWPDAERVNGISPAMVRDAPTLREITPQIREHLLGDKLVVGYNLRFDVEFLKYGNVIESRPHNRFDVMREYASVHGSRRSKFGDGYMYSSLSTCAESYGYVFRAHDAMEDARATAHCFRALLSDEDYLRREVRRHFERYRTFSAVQTKTTKAAVSDLVERGATKTVDAELRLGAVTQGKNKGMPRYECLVGDRCVGATSSVSIGRIRTILAIGADEDLPSIIHCKAFLSAAGARPSCKITLMGGDDLLERALAAAAETREREGFAYRPVQRKQVNRKPDRPVREVTPTHGASTTTHEEQGSSGWTIVITLLVMLVIFSLLSSCLGLSGS